MNGAGPRSTFLAYMGRFVAVYNDDDLPSLRFDELPR
jgi:hypothetical protein